MVNNATGRYWRFALSLCTLGERTRPLPLRVPIGKRYFMHASLPWNQGTPSTSLPRSTTRCRWQSTSITTAATGIARRTAAHTDQLPTSTQKSRRSQLNVPMGWFQVRRHGGESNVKPGAPTVSFFFVTKNGEEVPVSCPVGSNLLRVAQKHDVPLEGACEASIACSTCHVILEDQIFESLDSKEETEPSEREEDMLDMAFGLTETSRLGCQLLVTEDMEGMKVQLPKATRNFYVDGHVPQPH